MTINSNGPRVVEIGRHNQAKEARLTICDTGRPGLSAALAGLRAEMDGLTIKLAREYGRGSQIAMRAEEIAHSIQRLEWALEREYDGPRVS